MISAMIKPYNDFFDMVKIDKRRYNVKTIWHWIKTKNHPEKGWFLNAIFK